MKFLYFALICFAFVFSGCGSSSKSKAPSASTPAPQWQTGLLTFPDGKSITVDIANTPETREYGLMFRTSLPEDYGMLFVFPRQQAYQFWMKNTLVNLDMVFIDSEKKISEVYKSVPRSAPDTPEANLARRGGVAQFVLELPEGAADRHRLRVGQQFQFKTDIPLR